eukprot:TRINITY_DN1482_c0_g1_i2.p1 TRINITY_DN1482_c0_g1~~TRINITY_DN1482_c0_g1_i2.p1  ORF type:complete len:196 (-),score=49.59 TRINITY_DN1482_c0_g1_i2:41-628(-)
MLRDIFGKHGEIESISFEGNRNVGSIELPKSSIQRAYVKFSDEKGFNSAMNMKLPKDLEMFPITPSSNFGLKKWHTDWKIERDEGLHKKFEEETDALVHAYDQKKLQEFQEMKSRIDQDKEDGWTRVGKKVVAADHKYKKGDAKGLMKEKKIEGPFYKFQQRQRKENEILSLRKKFAEDKEKIAKLRESRKFKPY